VLLTWEDKGVAILCPIVIKEHFPGGGSYFMGEGFDPWKSLAMM
jgi:hypothetical protein